LILTSSAMGAGYAAASLAKKSVVKNSFDLGKIEAKFCEKTIRFE